MNKNECSVSQSYGFKIQSNLEDQENQAFVNKACKELYDINIKIDTSTMNKIYNNTKEEGYLLKTEAFKLQQNDIGVYIFFCKNTPMEDGYDPYNDSSKIVYHAEPEKIKDGEFFIRQKFPYMFLAGRIVNDFKAIDHNQIVCLQNSVIKHLISENNEKNQEINKLKNEVTIIQTRIEALEAAFLNMQTNN